MKMVEEAVDEACLAGRFLWMTRYCLVIEERVGRREGVLHTGSTRIATCRPEVPQSASL